ncbi:MAG: hypothetical protein LBQ97_03690 [Fusobacteriaceae bacterium]|nr:hypothetical protein [Fusobacteriaceae bacterium]
MGFLKEKKELDERIDEEKEVMNVMEMEKEETDEILDLKDEALFDAKLEAERKRAKLAAERAKKLRAEKEFAVASNKAKLERVFDCNASDAFRWYRIASPARKKELQELIRRYIKDDLGAEGVGGNDR